MKRGGRQCVVNRGAKHGDVYARMTGIHDSEVRMCGVLRKKVAELDREMKQWWREELEKIREACEGEDAGQSEGCAKNGRKKSEYASTLKILKEEVELDIKFWRKERRLLLNIINRREKEGGGKNESKMKGKGAEMMNYSLESVRTPSSGISRRESTMARVSTMETKATRMLPAGRERGDQERSAGGRMQRLRCPGRMKWEEFKRELERRRNRQRNIIVRWVRRTAKGIERDIKNAIWDKTRRRPYIAKMKETTDGVVVELKSVLDKKSIMTRNCLVKGGGCEITDDTTRREQEVQKWIEQLAEERRKAGAHVRTGYLKIWLEGELWSWNDLKGDMEAEKKYDRNKTRSGGKYSGNNGFRDKQHNDGGGGLRSIRAVW